jgi:ribosomal protein L3 glutamine methyltransferase
MSPAQSPLSVDIEALRTVRDLMRYAVSRFTEARLFFGHGCDNAWDEAACLVCYALHLPGDRLEVFFDARVLPGERSALVRLIDARVEQRVPTPYLTREAWLTGHRFYVDERVLIPRSFIAELLEDQLAPWIENPDDVLSVLDLCTGSACLAILAALAFPEAAVDAVDISSDALQVAERNRSDYVLGERLELIESDLFAELEGRRYDLIISNPPYVNAASMRALPAEYLAEPELALAGGEDGLDLVHIILAQARRHLTGDGLLVVEIGHNREVLEAAYPELPFVWLETASGNEFVFLLEAGDLPSEAV